MFVAEDTNLLEGGFPGGGTIRFLLAIGRKLEYYEHVH
jgi:hypothetical protein